MENRNKVFNPQIKQFDEETAKNELKKCPKIVQDYFKLIDENGKRWHELTNNAISQLRKVSKPSRQIAEASWIAARARMEYEQNEGFPNVFEDTLFPTLKQYLDEHFPVIS